MGGGGEGCGMRGYGMRGMGEGVHSVGWGVRQCGVRGVRVWELRNEE